MSMPDSKTCSRWGVTIRRAWCSGQLPIPFCKRILTPAVGWLPAIVHCVIGYHGTTPHGQWFLINHWGLENNSRRAIRASERRLFDVNRMSEMVISTRPLHVLSEMTAPRTRTTADSTKTIDDLTNISTGMEMGVTQESKPSLYRFLGVSLTYHQ